MTAEFMEEERALALREGLRELCDASELVGRRARRIGVVPVAHNLFQVPTAREFSAMAVACGATIVDSSDARMTHAKAFFFNGAKFVYTGGRVSLAAGGSAEEAAAPAIRDERPRLKTVVPAPFLPGAAKPAPRHRVKPGRANHG